MKIKKSLFFFVLLLIGLGCVIGCGKTPSVDTANQLLSKIVSISINPQSLNIKTGESIQFTFTAKDELGEIITLIPTWEVLGEIGEVSSFGLFVANKSGIGSVKVSYGSQSSICSVIVANDVGDLGYLGILYQRFSPNADGEKDSTIIQYSLSQEENVSMKLYDQLSKEVGTIFDGEKQGIHTFEWDGKTKETSQVVSDGEYVIKLFVEGLETAKIEGVIVDTTKPIISLDTNLSAISPDNNGINDELLINYSVVDNLSPSSEVRLLLWKGNKALGGLEDTNYPLPLEKSVVWDGHLSGAVIEGNYSLTLKAEDLAGNISITTKEVLVDNQSPQACNITVLTEQQYPYFSSLDNGCFSPNADNVCDKVTLHFYLMDNYSDNCYVTVKVFDLADNEIASLLTREKLVMGANQVTWEGFDNEKMQIVPDGAYKFKIILEDVAGNQCEYDSEYDHEAQWNGVAIVDTVPANVVCFNAITKVSYPYSNYTIFSYELSEVVAYTYVKVYKWEDLFYESCDEDKSLGSIDWNGSQNIDLVGQILDPKGTFLCHLEIFDRAGNFTSSEVISVYLH